MYEFYLIQGGNKRGWASIYIEMPLRAMDPKSFLLLLKSIKLVVLQLRAMDILALMITDNTNTYYCYLCKMLTYMFMVEIFLYQYVCRSQYIIAIYHSLLQKKFRIPHQPLLKVLLREAIGNIVFINRQIRAYAKYKTFGRNTNKYNFIYATRMIKV